MSRKVALVGNPNSGKTSLFNALTGDCQRVGNWSGVTVAPKEAQCQCEQGPLSIIDLPGTYSLNVMSVETALDEQVICHFIANQEADVYVNVVDASHLERHLYLTMQLLESRVPVIVALNMMDALAKEKKKIDIEKLQSLLGCPVIPVIAKNGEGLTPLKCAMQTYSEPSESPLQFVNTVDAVITDLESKIAEDNTKLVPRWVATRLFEEDCIARNTVNESILHEVDKAKKMYEAEGNEDLDIVIADHRYQYINKIMDECFVHQAVGKRTLTEKIDAIMLNRYLGIPLFLGVMYLLFFFAINVGGIFQSFFDITSDTIFVQGTAAFMQWFHAPAWFIQIIAGGVGKGINTTLTFIPVIGAMYIFLAMLELSGYMARAAFVMDRVMRALGLPGKSFVPMIVGFGCNVPAVLAARTLDNPRDRILTVVMSPFMSCGARLAIFAVFTSTFFPEGGQNVVFALYLIGILVAIITGMMLRKTLLRGKPSPLIMELPNYHMPAMTRVLKQSWHRLKGFVLRAGRLIVPISVLLGFLNSFSFYGTSLLEVVGHVFTPLLAPIGISHDNWPATVGLMTGVLAKEVVIGTLNTLYAQTSTTLMAIGHVDIWANLKTALATIPYNITHLGQAFTNPVAASIPQHEISSSALGQMAHRFSGKASAFAYLIFVLLYIPCVSTTAVIMRELNWRWAMFSVAWSTALAYAVAIIFYQSATFASHPIASSVWIGGMFLLFIVTVWIFRVSGRQDTMFWDHWFTGGAHDLK